MPVAKAKIPTWSTVWLRLWVAALSVILLSTLAIATAQPAEGRNYTREIAATRASQIAYERAMRSADQQLKRIKRTKKQTARKLKKARRNLVRVKSRRAALGERYRSSREELADARAALAAVQVPPPSIDAASAVLEQTGLSLELGPAEEDEPTDAALVPFVAGLGATRSILSNEISGGEVIVLKKRVVKQRKAFNKIKRKTRRMSRTIRSKKRLINALARQRRATIARREGAEAALGSRILSMSRLAQRRVNKKTKVRPGRNSGFAWPVRGRISQSYGCTGFHYNPPRGSCRHFHDGLDIVSYHGAPIRAAAIGVVSYIGWNPWDQNGRAFMIVVAHPGGYETLYGHVQQRRRVRVGQLVKRGEVIGYMGNTGRSTGTHLHLELRRGRTTLNPLGYL